MHAIHEIKKFNQVDSFIIMSDCRTMSRQFLREFVELYRDLPCLWQIKSKDYTDRNKKNEAYKILIKKLQIIQPNATKSTVVAKINSLRGGFRRENKKVLISKRSGTGPDDVYVPSLWYYDLLLFLRDQDTPRESTSNISNDDDEDNFEENYHTDDEGGGDFAGTGDEAIDFATNSQTATQFQYEIDPNSLISPAAAHTGSTQTSPLPNSGLSTPSLNKRRKLNKTSKAHIKTFDKSDQVLNVVSARLNNLEDEFSVIGKNISMKLRRLPYETKIYTEKLINDILFQAELGKITEHTRITSEVDEVIEGTAARHSSSTFHHLQPNFGWARSAPNNNHQVIKSDNSRSPSPTTSTSNY